MASRKDMLYLGDRVAMRGRDGWGTRDRAKLYVISKPETGSSYNGSLTVRL
jgi:hypothetical protein